MNGLDEILFLLIADIALIHWVVDYLDWDCAMLKNSIQENLHV